MIVVMWRVLFGGGMHCHEFVLRGIVFFSVGQFVKMSLFGLHSWICKVRWGMEIGQCGVGLWSMWFY